MMENINIKEKVIIALDFDDLKQVKLMLKKLQGTAFFYKIGFELFTSCGIKSVELVKDCGCKIFLDLKYHDIPNTVYKAVRSAGKLGADIINVHASGGVSMMKAAKKAGMEAEAETGRHADIIAVTVLTSLSDDDVSRIFYGLGESAGNPDTAGKSRTGRGGAASASFAKDAGLAGKKSEKESISSNLALHFAKLAHISGLDGVVCSGLESLKIKNLFGKNFKTVTPGIRMMKADNGAGGKVLEGRIGDDQKRIMTPSEAFNAGADYIVVGREVTGAGNPAEALASIYGDIENNLKI